MTDKQKAQIMLKAITDRFVYGVGNFSWLDGNKVGDCNNFANTVQSIFTAANIPVMDSAGDVYNGAHVWNMAYLDGQWYVVDATCAEYGYDGVMTIAQHESIYKYTFVEGKNNNLITKALLEAAYNLN